MDGSLCDHPVRKLLDLCQHHRLTGVLIVTSWGRSGRVEIRAGEIVKAAFGALEGHAATSELVALRDGLFELHQALPSVEAPGQRGTRLGLAAVMEQCRTRALSCRVEVVSRKQRAVITYRAGALEDVQVDGGPLPEGMNAAEVLAPFENGQVQVAALPLSLHESAASAEAAGEDSRPNRVPPAAAREDSRPDRVPPAAAREDSRPDRVPPAAAREDSRPNRVPAAPPPLPPAARQDSRPNRVPSAAAREDSRPNRVPAAPPPLPPAARQDSRPNRVPPAAAREDSRPNRVPAAPPPLPPLAAREDSRPNRAPAGPGAARPVPRPKVTPVDRPTLQPVPLQPASSSTSVPVALGRSQPDAPGAAGGADPWLDPDPSGATASLRSGLSRGLAVPALLTLIVVGLLLLIGFVALQP